MNAPSASGSVTADYEERTMIHRALLAAAAIIALGIAALRPAPASEAIALPRAGQVIADGLTEQQRREIAARLDREKLTLIGEARLKGQLVVATGVRQGTPWRLVIDPQTGEIIGRRPLSEPTALAR
jgi:hypothetical protein